MRAADGDLADSVTQHQAAERFAAAYDRRARKYASTVDPSYVPIYRRIVELARIDRETKVLDIATGTGGVAREAATKGAEVVGIDVSPGMLEHARSMCPPTVSFQLAEASALPFADNSFDVTTCSFGLSHMPHASRVLGEARRVLKPGGRFVATSWGDVFNPSRDAVQATLDRYLPGRSDPFGDVMTEEIWGDPTRGRQMLLKAQFVQVEVPTERLDGVFAGAHQALDRVLAGPSRGELADAIQKSQQEQFRADALAAILARADLSWRWTVNYYLAAAPAS